MLSSLTLSCIMSGLSAVTLQPFGEQVPDADSAARPDLAAAVLADTPPAEPNAAKNVDAWLLFA